ncbi:hypothetical protein IAR50_000336 [Cryptococcus sp. DSM 104548]
MPPTPGSKSPASRHKAAHPYQRPAPSAPAAQPSPATKASKKSKKKAKREKKESIVSHPKLVSLSSIASPSPDKKKNKKKRKSNSREMQPSDVSATSVAAIPLESAADASSHRNAGAIPIPKTSNALFMKPVLADSHTNVPASTSVQTTAGGQPQKSSVDRELARMREEAKQREAAKLELLRARDEIEKLKKVTEVAKKQQKDMQKKVEELEKAAARGEEQKKAFDGVLQRQDATKNDLTEALSCNVCFDIYRDPYILSCGHMACKECLHQWFRSSASFRQPLASGEISPLSDLSHRTKICHMCRCNIVRRPTRAYFLRTILEPLGLYNNTIEEGSDVQAGPSDPWHLTFPADPQSHKLFDEADGISRCPECLGEVADGACLGCDLEFSESEGGDEDEGDWDHADGRIAGIMSDMFEGVYRQVNDAARNQDGGDGDESDSASETSPSSNRSVRPNPSAHAQRNLWLERSDDGGHSEEDSYEDSFIDDDELEALSGEDETFLDDSFNDDDGADGRIHRGGPPPRVRTIASDSEDESDQPVFMGRGRRNHGRAVIPDSDESSE